jgi:hypothetical protein
MDFIANRLLGFAELSCADIGIAIHKEKKHKTIIIDTTKL